MLLGDDIRHIRSTPIGALLILVAAIAVGVRHRAAAQMEAAVRAERAVGLDDAAGLAAAGDPGAVLRSASGVVPDRAVGQAWFAILYNIFLAGTLAHWAWFTLARTLPVAVSSLSSLPVPVVGVFAGMMFLGERPGVAEFIALALVLASLFAVLFQPKAKEPPPATASEPSP